MNAHRKSKTTSDDKHGPRSPGTRRGTLERDEMVKQLLHDINVKEIRKKYAQDSVVVITTDHLGWVHQTQDCLEYQIISFYFMKNANIS